jgi:ABC-type lipoprotein export system ATPase subunit
MASVRALDIELLQINKGEFVAVTGPSGCGKTTLLNLIGALDRPTRGNIVINNVNVSVLGEAALSRFRREMVGFIFQSYCLIPSLSVLQNVLVPAYPVGAGRNCKDKASRLLHMVGLAGKENRRPAQLSGGEQQRVAVARALLLDPEIILADEPTGNLDSATGSGIIALLKKMSEEGKTVVIATHDRRVAGRCGRNIKLEDGRLIPG